MNNNLSTQVCGCDPGADWLCERHRLKELIQIKEDLLRVLPVIAWHAKEDYEIELYKRIERWAKS